MKHNFSKEHLNSDIFIQTFCMPKIHFQYAVLFCANNHMRKGEIIFSIYTCFAIVYLKRNVTTFYCLFPFHALTKLHAFSFMCFFYFDIYTLCFTQFSFLSLNLLFKNLMILKNAMNDIRFHTDINYVFMLSSLQFSCLGYKTLFYANSFFLHSKIHSFLINFLML